MQLNFLPFDIFIRQHTTPKTRRRYPDAVIKKMEVQDGHITAGVQGTAFYEVEIFFDQQNVFEARCSCPYDYGGYCKHIVLVLVSADKVITNNRKAQQRKNTIKKKQAVQLTRTLDGFLLSRQSITDLNVHQLQTISEDDIEPISWSNRLEMREANVEPNRLTGSITKSGYAADIREVEIQQEEDGIRLYCNCRNPGDKLCMHLHAALHELQSNKWLQLAFNEEERHRLLKRKAIENGWESLTDFDAIFSITYSYGRVHIDTKVRMLSYTDENKRILKQQLLPKFILPQSDVSEIKEFIVVERSSYDDYLQVYLMSAPIAKSAKGIKSPIERINLHTKIKHLQNREETLFYLALLSLSTFVYTPDNYQQIIGNPLGLDFYIMDEQFGKEKVTPQKLSRLAIQTEHPTVTINIKESGGFYIMTCDVHINGKSVSSKNIAIYQHLFIHKGTLYSVTTESENNVLQFFKYNSHQVYLQQDQFAPFKADFLDALENTISISYSFIKPAPKKLIKQKSLDRMSKYFIYLSELDEFVLITPAVSYGDIEVPVLSRRTIYTSNPDGTLCSIERNEVAEHQFIRNIQTQHPSFDKVPQTDFYYLHKKEFLDDGWFIHAFEAWRTEGYTIMGFNKLKNNRYNENKIRIKTSVQSGIDWFDIHTKINFGNQNVSLKEIQKSIVNKTRFVELGDGTRGILPEEWINKFTHYFRAGEIKKDSIRTHKSNFQLIDELFEQEVLSEDVQQEIIRYKEKLANFHSISNVSIPKKLKATLRDYQKEGLNWLSFLDEFGFGGCLADDMGLGKTVQVIAYFLAQHEKGNNAPNLVVVPTSLLFNWQKELERFAPHLKQVTLHGSNRDSKKADIAAQDVVLITYGTLLSEVELLKEIDFNIIVLDESQAIKNPDSKRYKAVRLLNGRQRLAVTGTPLENNTFDLFAQLSFALPGLLGTAKRFATDYSTPIDKFQDDQRALELQRKIHPFVLRRTKKQVAKELPEKTEMIVYCEMGTEQRRIYNTYKQAFQKYLKGIDEEELHSSSLHILQGLTKLRQLCNSPALLADDEFYGDQSAKLEELMEQIGALRDAHKILVFSQFVGMLDLIKERLDQANVGYAYLTGKTKKREKQVALFQEDEQTRVFLISLKAGGTGLNLTQAEYVFLIDPWWNPAAENQAIDRAYRIGQQNKVVAVRFITPDSIEEKILELQQRKRQLADDLVHTDSNMFKQLTKDDLLDLL